jgi:hypothetical protein
VVAGPVRVEAGQMVSRLTDTGFTGTLYCASTLRPAAAHASDGIVSSSELFAIESCDSPLMK